MSIAVNTEAPVPSSASPVLTGPINLILRLEGGAVLALSCLAYRATGASWWVFALGFVVPDVTMLGYVANRRIGAAVYNIGHTYLTPACLALAGVALGLSALWLAGLIWAAHIGFDRLLGVGLKYPQGFQATHLSAKLRAKGEPMS